jgi:diadenosine tetraphosphate (Ap4A) HIT family hydrolase
VKGVWYQSRVTTDFRADRIGSALRNENPTVMRKLPGSFAVLGDVQWLPGYSVLLVDRFGVSRLTDLDRAGRLEFLASMELLAEAVELACTELVPGFRRVNLEILGNTDDFLHAHIWPRYDWETPERVAKPVWLYPPEFWSLPSLNGSGAGSTSSVSPRDDQIREAIERQLDRLRSDPGGGASMPADER